MVLLDDQTNTLDMGRVSTKDRDVCPQAEEKKMTYNEWRQMRKRRKILYKAPVCQTRLQSLEVQAGYSIRLSVVITAHPAAQITWTIDDEEIEESDRFTFSHDESENRYSLHINQITPLEAGCYQCIAENTEGSDSTLGFISVKDPSKQRRRRSVSRRPLVSTIKEWKSKEEPEYDPIKERLLLRNRHSWDWWNLSAASEEDIHASRKDSSDFDFCFATSQTEEEWEAARLQSQMNSVRCRSLPNMSTGKPVENKYAKLRSFWEKQKYSV